MLHAPAHRNYIDALRGYAILSVMMVHTLILTIGVSPLIWSQVGRGGYGVQLFFVVSALTLAHSWHDRQDGILPFYIRRVFRIAPMFWLAIFPFLYIPYPWGAVWNHDNATLGDVFFTASLIHGLHPLTFNEVVPGGWSIAVEVTFYAVFPLLMLIARNLRRTLIMIILYTPVSWAFVRIGFYIFADSGAAPVTLELFATRWLPAQLPVFLCGILTSYFIRTEWVTKDSWAATGVLGSGCILLFGIFPFIKVPMTLICLVYAVAFSLVAFGLARGAGRFIVNRPICFLGKISFSAYLWHFAILSFAAPTISALHGTSAYIGTIVLVVSATVAASKTTYENIEVPMIRLGARAASKLARNRRSSEAGRLQPIPSS